MGNGTTFVTSCPSGGSFFLCPNTPSLFIGCCQATDPCSKGCSAGQLQPVSVNATLIGNLPDQQCPSGSQFYQCGKTNPTFWGCCKSNPCKQNGCPASDLTAALLAPQQALWQVYAGNVNLTGIGGNNDGNGTDTDGGSSGPPLGAIIGGAVGGAIALILIIAAWIFFWARRRRDVRGVPVSQTEWHDTQNAPTMYTGYTAPSHDEFNGQPSPQRDSFLSSHKAYNDSLAPTPQIGAPSSSMGSTSHLNSDPRVSMYSPYLGSQNSHRISSFPEAVELPSQVSRQIAEAPDTSVTQFSGSPPQQQQRSHLSPSPPQMSMSGSPLRRSMNNSPPQAAYERASQHLSVYGGTEQPMRQSRTYTPYRAEGFH